MWISDQWKDYTIVDTSDGEKLEFWGKYSLVRPDPQVIWKSEKKDPLWRRADARYQRSRSGGGSWNENRLPESWTIGYRDLTFQIKPMGFKHTGLFPEQAANWDWFRSLIENAGRPIRVLNLFAYTGGATVAAAKENARLSGLADAPIRYIVDDCKKFIEREIRRGNKYDGIIMDPPSYGRGPGGEVWKLEDSIDEFVGLAAKLLSREPLFFLINSYTTGLSPLTMSYILDLKVRSIYGGEIESGEIGLRVSQTGAVLPCGASTRWTAKK